MARCDKCGCHNGEHIIDCPNNPEYGNVWSSGQWNWTAAELERRSE